MLWNITDEPRKVKPHVCFRTKHSEWPSSKRWVCKPASLKRWGLSDIWIIGSIIKKHDFIVAYEMSVGREKCPWKNAFVHATYMKWIAKLQLAYMCMFMSENRISFLLTSREGNALWFACFRQSSVSDISQSFEITLQHGTRWPAVPNHFDWHCNIKNYCCPWKFLPIPRKSL